MLQEEDSCSAGRLPAVKNADHCLTWEVFPSPLQAMKPGNEGEAAGVGQAERTARREGERARQGPDSGSPAEVSWACCLRGCEGAVAGPQDITPQAWTKSHQKSASRSHLLAKKKKEKQTV